MGHANYYFKTGNLKTADTFYRRTLKILDKDIYKHDIAFILTRLGEIRIAEENFAEARRFFNKAAKLNYELSDKIANSQTLFDIAKLDLIEQNFDSASNHIKESLDLTESFILMFQLKLKRTYFSNIFDRYELYINLLMKMQNNPNENYSIQALQAAEKSRARSMLEKLLCSPKPILQKMRMPKQSNVKRKSAFC